MILPMSGGGAKQLAIRVQIGAAQPTGAAGMLWVETALASNKWTAAVAEPTGAASGDLWVQTDGVNAHVIEMLRENSIRINVLRVRQYDGSAWISKNASYHDGTGWTQVSSAFNPLMDVAYTGDMVMTVTGIHWDAEFRTSGTLTVAVEPPDGVDAFLVGGGASGGNAYYGGSGGGGSGHTGTYPSIFPTVGTGYPIVIGAGGAKHTNVGNGNDGGTTTAFGHSAPGGDAGKATQAGENDAANGGGNGGSGGGGYASNAGGSDGSNGAGTYGGTGQGTTTRAYGEAAETLYAGGGGSSGGAGGNGGGGAGNGAAAGQDGAANTGGGGGAGTVYVADRSNGAGGSGIVRIRDHRA